MALLPFLKTLFSAKGERQDSAFALYMHVAQTARQPVIFEDFHVPDTAQGRYEVVVFYAVLVLERLKQLPDPAAELAQDFVDTLFEQLDHALRELGIGDLSVGKRMKKMAQGFYGRAQVYGDALREDDVDTESRDIQNIAYAHLAHALAKNIYGDATKSTAKEVLGLAHQFTRVYHMLQKQPLSAFLSTTSPFVSLDTAREPH
jgi:cytochrome b pre-mRNA-processing protein 3